MRVNSNSLNHFVFIIKYLLLRYDVQKWNQIGLLDLNIYNGLTLTKEKIEKWNDIFLFIIFLC